jgi:uroporphyrinogen-III synthase
VDHFFANLTEVERARVTDHAQFASIGETTTAAIRKYGKEPEVVAKNATIADLHEAVVERYARTDV